MFQALKSIKNRPALHRGITEAKKLWYRGRGEPIEYGEHKLRYLSGTRPVRLKYIDSPDVVVRNDASQIKFFIEQIKPGDFVLDIGGHVGQYAVLFASLVRDSGRVITFEPDPEARDTLRNNLELNGFANRVVVESVALFDQNGEHSFFSKGADSMSSLARSGLGANASSLDIAEYRVKTIRLDDYLNEKGFGYPRFVKLDTEGAEINILRGARELLQSDTTIVCELHPYAWDEFGTSFEELLQIVSRSDKSIHYLEPSLRIEAGAFYGAAIIK
ncbi:MAG: FkbM family methyltransferase [Pyrinomonadaceae bacterium]